ncbi:hypothetical protein ACFWJQ_00635 [Streptomyces goshikiensis]|uniref:hypothetical protein n=1 Tax=Streptomyces goshikiensis TaxID=1942 RepID=UPI00364A6124
MPARLAGKRASGTGPVEVEADQCERLGDLGGHLKVDHEGKVIPFGKLVQARKRQLTKTDPELVTLSGLRVLVICVRYGREGLGLGLTSATLHDDALP